MHLVWKIEEGGLQNHHEDDPLIKRGLWCLVRTLMIITDISGNGLVLLLVIFVLENIVNRFRVQDSTKHLHEKEDLIRI